MNNYMEIILVEDNKSDADLIMRALRKNNVANKIVHLKDGQEALDFFEASYLSGNGMEVIPRIILLDLKMPKVNGIQVLQQLKSNEQTKNIPIIMLTSSKEESDLEQCYKLGVNSYVVKPLTFEDFVKTVSQLGIYWSMINQQK